MVRGRDQVNCARGLKVDLGFVFFALTRSVEERSGISGHFSRVNYFPLSRQYLSTDIFGRSELLCWLVCVHTLDDHPSQAAPPGVAKVGGRPGR